MLLSPTDDAGLTGKVRDAANKIAADSEKAKEAADRINYYENETAKMRVEVDKMLEGASKDDISKAREQGIINLGFLTYFYFIIFPL